jgi:uncharacterized protein (DUF2236 family)
MAAPARTAPFRSRPARGHFDEGSMLRRVLSENVAQLSGPRALLMMAAHPVAFEGFFMATGTLDDPYGRLQRTAVVMNEIGFGRRQRAQRMTQRVRAQHHAARGVLPVAAGKYPAGTEWKADDPKLLLWIIACLMDSVDLVHRRYIGPLSRDERQALWSDYRLVGREFGLAEPDMPETIEEFDAYMREMVEGDELFVTDRARELGIEVVLHPPLPAKLRPLVEVVNFITIGLLPANVRRGYGFSWDPLREATLRANQQYVRRVLLPLLPDRLRMSPQARAQARELAAAA